MLTFAIRIIQTYRAQRWIEIPVEGDDNQVERALEDIRSGNTAVPPFDDPRWQTDWQLQSKDVEPASLELPPRPETQD